MADTTKTKVKGAKKKVQGEKTGAKSKQGNMKEGKKSGGKKAPKGDPPAVETSGKDTKPMEMEITDLDPEGAIGEDKVDNAAHEKLLSSIYAMDGRKRPVSQVRGTGMASSNVDLLVHSKIDSAKIQAQELNIKSKKTQLVPKPLSVYETEKAKRHIARDVMEKDTKKWEPIVNEIRVAPQIKYAERPKGVEMYKAMQPHKFSPKTPLEIELYEALGKSEDTITPNQPLTKAEERALKAMSVKEAMARRRELLKHNELLFRSQKEGKRQNKIKSKRYRRGIRMEKAAQTKKTVEEMEKTDPEAYLEKLDKVDEARMEERLTLRHKSGGKFARYHKAFSKFDDSKREALQEMVRKGQELSQKRHIESSDEEEEEMVSNPFVSSSVASDELPDRISKASNDLNTKHLEIMKSISKKAGGWLDGSTRHSLKDSKSGEKDGNNESNLLASRASQSDSTSKIVNSKKRKRSESAEDSEEDNLDTEKADESGDVEDQEADHSAKRQKVTSNDKSGKNSPEKSKKKKQNVDESEIEDTIKQIRQKLEQDNTDQDKGNSSSPEKSNKKKKRKIEADVKTNTANPTKNKQKRKGGEAEDTIFTPSGMEQIKEEDEDEEEKEVPVTMEELFEDEDVVEQFARDKAEEEEKRKPKKEKIIKLPGWGSWTGPDFQAEPKEKKKERRRKFQPGKRVNKDANANLWLNPNRDKAIRELQPKKVPFPYVDAEQYAAAIRQPVSRGFVREVAHKILVKPEVVTKLGNIIKPLDREDFFKDKNAIDVDDGFGKQIKYTGHVNFRSRDNRLKTQAAK